MELIKPAPLKKGDKIGVVAPSGSVRKEQLMSGVEVLVRAGFRVEVDEGVEKRKGYLAGSEQGRAKSLQGFFRREDISAIFCARGGFGSIQLLPLLDTEEIRLHPKIFVGYSDISILLNWFLQECRMAVFHGPMVAMDIAEGLRGSSEVFFWDTLLGEKRRWQIEGSETIRSGVREAEMVGGCLSVLVTTLGTPYELKTEGKILFLEDIGERPYRIERMLTHLQMAGKLEELAGLIFGNFSHCGGEPERGLGDIIHELFRDAPYPVITGFPAGHGDKNLILPFGVKMALDGKAKSLSLLESPVS